jgi:hypothetical protein
MTERDPANVSGGNWLFTKSGSKKILGSITYYANYRSSYTYDDTYSYDAVSTDGAIDAIKDLIASGVLFGVVMPDTDDDPTIVLPVTSGGALTTANDENLISGKDAMGLALFYYWSAVKNEFVTYSGSSSRHDTFTYAAQYFNNVVKNLGNSISINANEFDKSKISRSDVFVIIACCIQKYSNGKIRLADYSNTKLGYMQDGTTKVNSYDDSSGATIDGKTVSDVSLTEGQSGVTIQAINMLIDLNIMRGRSIGNGQVAIDPNGTCTYSEYYRLLWRYPAGVAGKYTIEAQTEFSLFDPAALTATGNSGTISYRDFLNGSSVSVSAYLDTSSTYSKAAIKSYRYSLEDTTHSKSTSATATTSTKTLSTAYYASDVGFTESVAKAYGGVKPYTVDLTGAVTMTDKLGGTGSASDTTTATINIINYAPEAKFTTTTDALSGTIYKSDFYYADSPITITDKSSDWENALSSWHYTIQYNGATIASVDDFDDILVTKVGDSYISDISADADKNTISVTFAKAGNYTK